MLQAKKNLQCPFVFHACDGIFTEKIPMPDHNWIGGYVEDWNKTDLPLSHYRTHTMKDKKVVSLNEKGVPGFDSLHIGIDGILDYEEWWEIFQAVYDENPNDLQISDVPVLAGMMKRGISFEWLPFKTWLDTGNLDALKKTEAFLSKNKK